MNRRLYRSRTDSMIGGVAGGVAEYLDIDPTIVRIVWAVLAIVTSGVFFVLYIVMWIVVPEGAPAAPASHLPGTGAAPPAASASPPDTEAPPVVDPITGQPAATAADATAEAPAWSPAISGSYEAERRRRPSDGAMVFGLILILLGAWFLVDEYLPAVDTDLLWPIALVIIGLALLFVSLRRRDAR
ncbi:MAG TPA: PspC domain-containing protein [Candidatus Limnocylindria bacterium]|nr:PspC domain-containing protein [Candidatus Limnocylindria bacterium]